MKTYFNNTEEITEEQALCYECSSCRIALYAYFGWLQWLIGVYIASKTARKHKRYLRINKLLREKYGDIE